jgi:hypothetical protein
VSVQGEVFDKILNHSNGTKKSADFSKRLTGSPLANSRDSGFIRQSSFWSTPMT